jgi:hypothetical protein
MTLAKDIKVGDTIDGWTVTERRDTLAFSAQRTVDVGYDIARGAGVVLLTLERSDADPFKPVTLSRRSWYRADEEVEARE